MKKIASALLCFFLMLGIGMPAASAKTKDIDELLAPYRAGIVKVNKDLGSSFFIPDAMKEKVYNNIKNKTPTEFEELLRNEYKTFPLNPSDRTQSESRIKSNDAGSFGVIPLPNVTGSVSVIPIPNADSTKHVTPLN